MEYDKILAFLDVKYHEVYTSLFSFNDDVLDENLLHYLYTDNYVVLMKIDDTVEIMQGVNSSLYGYDHYGKVSRGTAMYQHNLRDYSQFKFDENNSVVIYSNRNLISMRDKIFEMLTELASVHYKMQNNLRLSDVKGIISASAKTASTIENVLSELLLSSKSYVVAKDKDKLINEIDKIDLDVDYIAEQYIQTIQFYHQQILEVFGINFTPHEKKERLVTDEVNSNNELLMRIENKTSRRFNRYLTKANEIFGTDFMIEVAEVKEPKETEEEDTDV